MSVQPMEFFPPAKEHCCQGTSDTCVGLMWTDRGLVYSTCVIGIIQLRYPLDFCVLDSWAFLVELGLSLELHPVHDAFHNPTRCGLQRQWRAISENDLWGYEWKTGVSVMSTCLMNLSLSRQVEPKFFCCRVIFSLVWESKVGFSIRQLTNSHMWFFTWKERAKHPHLSFLTEYSKVISQFSIAPAMTTMWWWHFL